MRRRDFLATAGGSVLAGGGVLADAVTGAGQEPESRYRVIDTHLHLFNAALELPAHLGGTSRTWATAEKTVAALRRGGVEKAFLISYSARDIASQIADPVASAPVYSKDYMVATWQRHKDLFYWFPDHVDPSREGYLKDLRRDLEMGASGVKILSAFHGFLPDNPGFMPVYEICRQYKKPVIIDGSFWYFRHMPPRKEPAARQKEAMTYAGYAKTLSAVFRRFPDVPFSLAHTGTARSMSDYDQIYKLIADHKNVSCDVAAATGYSAVWLERLVRAVGARKVMYGTDWPYWASGVESYLKGSRRWTMVADECPGLSENEMQWILAENAERFLNNQLPPADTERKKTAAALQERARALHDENIVIVIHDHKPIAPEVPRMLAGGVTAKVYQLGVDIEIGANYMASAPQRKGWSKKILGALDEVERTIKADPEHLLLATTVADIGRAKREGKVAILLGVEGGKLLEGKLELLRTFYDRGLRELQLRWAVPNQIVEDRNLTGFGRQVVHGCNRLGVIVGLTHLPTRAFHEMIELTEKPVIVSHGVAARQPERRSDYLGDRQLKALAGCRGVIGIHFYTTYLGPKPTVRRVVEQVDHIAEVAGIETVALGIDFFPTEGKWGDFQRGQGATEIAWAIPDIGQVAEVTEALLARNYQEEDIKKVLGGNFLRVCKEVFGK